MYLTLINPAMTPPGGWRYTCQETGFQFCMEYGSGTHGLEKLCEHIAAYRRANNMSEIKNLPATVTDWVCKQKSSVNAGCCREEKRTLGEMASGTKAMLKTMHPNWHVSQPIAEARAAICLKCPMKVNPNTNGLEKIQDNAAEAMSAPLWKDSTLDISELHKCGLCRCPLKSKVWFQRKDITPFEKHQAAAVPPGMLDVESNPMTCWMIQDVEQSQP